MDRDRAAHRLAAIAGFKEEAARLERMGLLRIDAETRKAIAAYHREVLGDLNGEDGIPADAQAPHWGLRAAAAGGLLVLIALGLAGLDLLWPSMADWARIATAIALPAVFLLLAEALRTAGRDPLFVVLMAGIAALAFALDLRIVTAIFNRPFGLGHAVAAGAFAAALGHRYASRTLAAGGLLVAGAALASLIALADGRLWPALPGRLDPLLATGLATFGVGLSARLGPAMQASWRLAGLALSGAALIALAHPGTSLLPMGEGLVAGVYQALALLAFAAAMIAGLFRRWRETVYGGLALMVGFLLDRLRAWFAPVLPEAMETLMLIAAAALFLGLAALVRRLERRMGAES